MVKALFQILCRHIRTLEIRLCVGFDNSDLISKVIPIQSCLSMVQY